MIVLDTHAWIWAVASPEKLSDRARSEVEQADALGVATISAWEVAMLAARDRIELDREVRAWVSQALRAERVQPLPLSADIAVAAALLGGDARFPGDPADGIIYATARASSAPLITRDEALRRFDPDGTVW